MSTMELAFTIALKNMKKQELYATVSSNESSCYIDFRLQY